MKMSYRLTAPVVTAGLLFAACTASKNGSTGKAIQSVQKVATGAECPHGGMRFTYADPKEKSVIVCEEPVAQPTAVAPAPSNDGAVTAPGMTTILPEWPGNLIIDASTVGHIDFYNHIAKVNGDLVYNVEGADTVNMPYLKEVTGDVLIGATHEVAATQLRSLQGFAALSRIGGELTIAGNPQLLNLNGLDELVDVQRITVSHNPRLSTIAGFAQVKTLPAGLLVVANPSLSAVTGFGALEQIGDKGTLQIVDNDALTSVLGLAKVARAGDVEVALNGALPKLDGFGQLAEVSNNVRVQDNTHLQDIAGLANLVRVGKTLTLVGNRILGSEQPVGLPKLVSVGSFEVQGNDFLEHLAGFVSFEHAENLRVMGNANLRDLDMPKLVVTGRLAIGAAPDARGMEREGHMGREQINHYKWIFRGRK